MSEKGNKQLGTHCFEEHNTANNFAAQNNISGASHWLLVQIGHRKTSKRTFDLVCLHQGTIQSSSKRDIRAMKNQGLWKLGFRKLGLNLEQSDAIKWGIVFEI